MSNKLLKLFPEAVETFGYITKANRYQYGFEKNHANDAFVIAGGSVQKRNQNKGAYLKMTHGLKPIVKSMKKIEIIFHQKGVIYA